MHYRSVAFPLRPRAVAGKHDRYPWWIAWKSYLCAGQVLYVQLLLNPLGPEGSKGRRL